RAWGLRQREEQRRKRGPVLKLGAAATAAAFMPTRYLFAAAKYRFGFSQVTTVAPWRVQFNKDMKKEAEQHPELELLTADGQDKTEKQVADVETFISQAVDVL